MMDRDKQIELMNNAEKRVESYFKRWLAKPEYRAILHRYDSDDDNGDAAATG